MRLTFVCSGNTCRSPLAVAAWQCVVREADKSCREQLARIAVESAGLNARSGARATGMAQLIAASWDADLSDHRARVWRPRRAENDEEQVIVTMTGEQTAQVRFRLETQRAPGETLPVIETLGAFVAADTRATAPPWSDDDDEFALDIPDPYGGSSEAYEECGERIRRAVLALARNYCRE